MIGVPKFKKRSSDPHQMVICYLKAKFSGALITSSLINRKFGTRKVNICYALRCWAMSCWAKNRRNTVINWPDFKLLGFGTHPFVDQDQI